MPSGSTSLPPGPSATLQPTAAASAVAKADAPVKQIAICTIQSPGNSMAASAQSQTRAPVSSGQFISSAGAVTSLGFMINRFATDGRQAVLLQPRGAAGQPVVVTTSAAQTRYIQIPQHHTIRTIVPAAVAPASRNNTIQLMNLSVSNPTPNTVHPHASIKTATGSRSFPNTLPLEPVGLVFQNPGDSTVRPIRLQTTAGQTVTGKTITARPQQPKIINLTTTGNNVTTARHNILLGTSAGTSGKPAILNLNKSASAVIINPNSTVQLSGATAAAGGSFSAARQPNSQAKPAIVPVNSAVMTIAATGHLSRHHPIGAVSTAAAPFTTQRLVTSNQQQHPASQPVTQHHIVSISGASALKPNSGNSVSPMKQQQIQNATPASPRPSILNRKRVLPDTRPVNLLLTPSKIETKTEPEDDVQGTSNGSISVNRPSDKVVSTSSQEPAPTTTPRKKPRKQLLEPFDLSSSTSIKLLNCADERSNSFPERRIETQSSQEEEFDIDDDQDQEETDDASQEDMDCEGEDEYEEEDDEEEEIVSTPSPIAGRRPRISLFMSHPPNWKALQHHFLRYSDVKPKPEKKMTLSELSNEGLQKKNGWKIHHLATQMDDMGENESELLQRLNTVLHRFEEKIAPLPALSEAISPDLPFPVSLGDKLTDLIRGNIQRSSLFQEQIAESKQLLIKLTNDHRERVGKLTKKNINKRTCISK